MIIKTDPGFQICFLVNEMLIVDGLGETKQTLYVYIKC